MARQPSVDPNRRVLGRGTASEKSDILDEIDPKDKQLWYMHDVQDNIVDVEQYSAEKGEWVSILGELVRSVSDIEPDSDGNIPQVTLVDGPSPEESGEQKQLGIDESRNEIYIHWNGSWILVGSLDTATGAIHTHSIDPNEDQVNDPSSSPSIAISSDSGSLTAGDYKWAITFVAPWGETLIGTSATDALNVSDNDAVDLSSIPTASEDVVDQRNIYRTTSGGSTFYFVNSINDNNTTTYTDGKADADLGSEAPNDNTTEAHNGTLPESVVDFAIDGHSHDGTNSSEIVIPDHDINPEEGPHVNGLPWSQLENVPAEFFPSEHDLDPAEGPHTGAVPWSDVEGNPTFAEDPHGDEDHSEDYAKTPHDNTAHSNSYITSAAERIRYGAGQLGEMNKISNLQPPVPVDVDGEAVKAYAVARIPPDTDVSGTITVEDSSGTTLLDHTITLPAGDRIATNTSISKSLSPESIIRFSLNDSDDAGQDFAVYLIVETEIGS